MMRGMGNINQIMKQAQQMQAKLAQVQENLKNINVEASSGGGAVTVTASCDKRILSVKIDKELISGGDVEMIQDLITAAANEALNKANETAEEEMKKITGGINFPGIF